MAFQAYEFTFNGVSCVQHDLMMYDAGGERGDVVLPASGEVQLEHVFTRQAPVLLGVKREEVLKIPMVFGLCPQRVMSGRYLERQEIERIATWLTEGNEWGWLSIDQADLEEIRYRCRIQDLKPISSGWRTYAFTATAICDSPYAYMYPQSSCYHSKKALEVDYLSRSSKTVPYSPILEVDTLGSTDISISNRESGWSGPGFQGLPDIKGLHITIDNETMVMTNSEGLNLYPYFNFEYLRLKRGYNRIKIEGNCDVTITSAFPVNVGG